MLTPDALTGAAATIVMDRNQSILVVHSVRRGSWDCPGGRREPGETVFRAELNIARPTVVPGDDVDEAHWVSHDEFRDRCRERFWWPLAAFVLDLGP